MSCQDNKKSFVAYIFFSVHLYSILFFFKSFFWKEKSLFLKKSRFSLIFFLFVKLCLRATLCEVNVYERGINFACIIENVTTRRACKIILLARFLVPIKIFAYCRKCIVDLIKWYSWWKYLLYLSQRKFFFKMHFSLTVKRLKGHNLKTFIHYF